MVSISCIVKNEADSLLEWVAFHILSGCKHFYIADNSSTDNTRDILIDLSRLGLITWISFPNPEDGGKPQLPAYMELLSYCRNQHDETIAFIDADEYLLPMGADSSLTEQVNHWFADDDVSAVVLNWAIFGSSGERFSGEGTVLERFQQRAKQDFSVNQHYKVIVRPERVIGWANPHHPYLSHGRIVNTRGEDLVLHPKHGMGLSDGCCWDGMRINHYAVKSLEEFLLGKHLRGSAAKEGRIKHRQYFELHDRNDEHCDLAARLAPKVKAEMDRLQALMDALPDEEPPPAPAAQPAGLWQQGMQLARRLGPGKR